MDFGLGGAVFPETKTKRKFGFCENTLRTAGQMDFVNSVLVLKTKEKKKKILRYESGIRLRDWMWGHSFAWQPRLR